MRLPDAALVRTTPQVRERLADLDRWPVQAELLAQLIEEVSILAAEHRRAKPRQVKRPTMAGPVMSRDAGIKHAIGVFRASSARVYRPTG